MGVVSNVCNIAESSTTGGGGGGGGGMCNPEHDNPREQGMFKVSQGWKCHL